MRTLTSVFCIIFMSLILAGCCGHRGGHRGWHHGHGHHAEMIDADKDGNLSKAEWDGHFKEVDNDGDGVVTPAERQAFHKAHCKHCTDRRGDCPKCAAGEECKECGKCPDCKQAGGHCKHKDQNPTA